MRKVLLTMIILLTSYATIFAQGIEIAFALPVGNCQLSDNTAKMLRSKFLPAMTESGVETAEVSTIAIKPEISFVNKQVVEGGMRNIHTSDIQFNFVCTNLATSTTFASCFVKCCWYCSSLSCKVHLTSLKASCCFNSSLNY